MGIEDGSTKFYLTKSFLYSLKGTSGQKQAKFIELREPGFEHQNEYFKLSQMVSKAFFSMTRQKDIVDNISESVIGEEIKPFHEDTENIEKDSQDMESSLSMAINLSDIDVVLFIKTFQKMAMKKGVFKSIALIDGNLTKPLTDELLSRMGLDDIFSMAIKYCCFFVTSLITEMEDSSEKQPESVVQVKEV